MGVVRINTAALC